jgi:hypothetical protein
MKRCPICAELIDDYCHVCPSCGEILDGQGNTTEEITPKTATQVCPYCGETIDGHFTSCPICGENLVLNSGSKTDSQQAKKTVFGDSYEQKPVSDVPNVEKTVVGPPPIPEQEPFLKPDPYPKADHSPKPDPYPKPEPIPEPEPIRQPQETTTQRGAEAVVPPFSGGVARQEPPQKKGGNLLKILLISLIALLVIGLGILAYLYFSKDTEKNPGEEGEKTTEKEADVKPAVNVAKTTESILDSVAHSLPGEAYIIGIYPDNERKSLFYLLDGRLYVYHADNNDVEKIAVPMMANTDGISHAEIDESDETFLMIEVADKNYQHEAYYRLNTITEDLFKINENASSEEMDNSAMQENRKPDENIRNTSNNDPQPTVGNNVNTNTKNRKDVNNRRQNQNQKNKRNQNQQDEYVAPNSGGTGFHFESTNQPARSNNGGGSGFHLEKVN